MVRVRAVVVDRTMQYVSLESGRSHTTRSTQKGRFPQVSCHASQLIRVYRYVEMLEQQQLQLVNGLQELYERLVNQQGWKGAPLDNSSNGHPLTHDILERLGALKTDSQISYEVFEDNVDAMRKRLLADGALPMPRPSSAESEYDQSQTSFQDPSSPKLLFNEPLQAFNQFPPTPPSRSPQFQSSLNPRALPPSIKMEPSMDPDMRQFQPNTWVQPPLIYDEPMDFLPFDAASAYENMSSLQQGANPCLPTSDWIEDDLGAFDMNASMA